MPSVLKLYQLALHVHIPGSLLSPVRALCVFDAMVCSLLSGLVIMVQSGGNVSVLPAPYMEYDHVQSRTRLVGARHAICCC